ncbi:hypothetical protein Rsub_07770 [Raphidocelis subcapitata]|uniref:TOG domain-containing protein n=1 Tax=Raphidocelis subcapitata TaxID=307507 RepID=A0A2V0P8S3_9CHLO|nr:hypothetical protein Rsub_07770 [Raphidocelis subcapitata]|eukprot:GBF95342.1 hypothetical protein Rsub_07770 [Raphidocelis subcapitata]
MAADAPPSGASGRPSRTPADVWRELSAAHAKPGFDSLWSKLRSDGLRSKRAVQPASRKLAEPLIAAGASATLRPHTGEPQAGARSGGAASGAAAPTRAAAAAAPTAAAPSAERVAQQLLDPDAAVRRVALRHVQASLSDPASPAPPLPSGLVKPLLRRFEDASDACRGLAADAALALLRAHPGDVLALLPYVMPVLEERLSRRPACGASEPVAGAAAPSPAGPVEQSEEVRLTLVRLLHFTVSQVGQATCAYAGEVLAMLEAALADAYHEVCIEACACVEALAASLGVRLHPVSKQLAAALLPLTTHKRHRVRIAVLRALGPLLFQGAHEIILEMVGHRDPNLVPVSAFYGAPDLRVNFCGRLAGDANPQVRLEFLRIVGSWMLGLRERADHEGRLLPFVLAALIDDAPQVSSEAASLLDALGRQYESDHEAEVRELEAYCPEEADGPADAPPAALAAALPAALAARLRLGARLLVRDNAGRLLAPLCADLASWQAEPRARAAALLEAVLALIGPAAERHLQLLVPALVKAVREPESRARAESCCALVGAAVSTPALLALLLPRARDGGACARARGDALLCIAHAMRGAGAAAGSGGAGAGDRRHRGLREAVPSLVALLEDANIGQSDDTHVRSASLALAHCLVAACPAAALAPEAPRLAAVALLLIAPEAHADAAARDGGGAPGGDAEAAAAAAGAEAAEGLLAQLASAMAAGDAAGLPACGDEAVSAAAGGCEETVDRFMAAHRGAVLQLLSNLPLCPSSARHAAALCRALLPSAAARALYKPGAAARRCRLGQLAAGPGAEDACGTGARGGGDTSCGGSPWGAGPHLQHLLDALERAAPGAGAGGCGRPLQLLLAALDAALPPAPQLVGPGAPPTAALEHLLFSTAPLLLASGCSEAALAGARAVRRLLLMQLPPGESDCEGAGGVLRPLLRRGWRRCCLGVCGCLTGSCPPALRLQACLAAEAAADCLGSAAVEWGPDAGQERAGEPGIASSGGSSTGSEAGDPAERSAGPGEVHAAPPLPPPLPQPVCQLVSALDDAQDAVRCAAARALRAFASALAADGGPRAVALRAALACRARQQLACGGAEGCGELRAALDALVAAGGGPAGV